MPSSLLRVTARTERPPNGSRSPMGRPPWISSLGSRSCARWAYPAGAWAEGRRGTRNGRCISVPNGVPTRRPQCPAGGRARRGRGGNRPCTGGICLSRRTGRATRSYGQAAACPPAAGTQLSPTRKAERPFTTVVRNGFEIHETWRGHGTAHTQVPRIRRLAGLAQARRSRHP